MRRRTCLEREGIGVSQLIEQLFESDADTEVDSLSRVRIESL